MCFQDSRLKILENILRDNIRYAAGYDLLGKKEFPISEDIVEKFINTIYEARQKNEDKEIIGSGRSLNWINNNYKNFIGE